MCLGCKVRCDLALGMGIAHTIDARGAVNKASRRGMGNPQLFAPQGHGTSLCDHD